ncbi:MAG: response regulator transcription factor [Saprospiraceae bacterium]|nr:response regulator transcription factor [Saprospiraceae bacterium]
MEKAKILYVEDDETLSFITKDNLELNGYEVTHCEDGDLAIEAYKKDHYDLIILDVMLPKRDGFDVARDIRRVDTNIPILFLSAKSMKEDRIHGLELGGDDYITKPFSIEELILRIEVFLKRKYINTVSLGRLQLGAYYLDYSNLKLFHGEELVKNLTQKECDLLKLLIENKDRTLKRELILEKLWGENDYFLGRSMDVFISRLRKYLKKDPSIKIENVHGVGFRLLKD